MMCGHSLNIHECFLIAERKAALVATFQTQRKNCKVSVFFLCTFSVTQIWHSDFAAVAFAAI